VHPILSKLHKNQFSETTQHDFFSKKSTNYEKNLQMVHLHDDDFDLKKELEMEV